MRISGLATGLDTDNLIKDMMKPHTVRVDRVKNDRTLLKYKQDIYRNTIKQGKEFYNKYFTTKSENSIIMSSAWQGVSFESSNSAVTATGGSTTNGATYKVKVEKVATSTNIKVDQKELDGKESIKLEMKGRDGKVKSIEVKLTKTEKDKEVPLSKDEIVKNLNKELKANEIDVTAKYSDLAGGLVFTSNQTGKDVDFNVFVKEDKKPYSQVADKTVGEDARVLINYGGKEPYVYEGSSNTVTLDGVTFNFYDVTGDEEIRLTGKTDVKKTKDLIVNF
ncbi:MAG: flagellar cap protein FliD N-terminal domain-containing protein, partial [Clostridium sp.]